MTDCTNGQGMRQDLRTFLIEWCFVYVIHRCVVVDEESEGGLTSMSNASE